MIDYLADIGPCPPDGAATRRAKGACPDGSRAGAAGAAAGSVRLGLR